MLDTVIIECYIDGRQKEMLADSMGKALQNEVVDHIYDFLHHPIFLHGKENLICCTNQWCKYGANFHAIYHELLLPASAEKPTYLLAGDVGAYGGDNLTPFYYQFPESDMYAVAIGLGDSEKDGLI